MPPPAHIASPKSVQTDKLASFIAFSQTLLRRLPSANDPLAIDPLLAELEPQLEMIIKFHTASRAKPQRGQLDKKGTELWNICTRLRRDDVAGVPPTRKKLLLQSRAYAFLMITVARDAAPGAKLQMADVVHLMRLMLKAGRMCIGLSLIKESHVQGG
ncbi:hypothetical protein Ct61P_05474 [Colletotrichum tofieldiae]|nr:hypothetical protein Ct61P_05474 [Colletotrichum tofieldiae]